ncbi:MAG: peptide chain release factor N(5)-glutamine methyltransferase [Alphaproteobacteria bacterium]
MKTISNIYKNLCQHMSDLEARLILKERAQIQWSDIIATPNREIEDTQILTDLAIFKSGKPLSRIYGKREFWGLEFKVTEHTLDPRPDSETLIEAVLNRCKTRTPQTILDLGTGTGCLLLALLSEFPEARGQGVDISGDALCIARENAKSLGLDNRAEFIQSNWTESVESKFDLVISNPPYIESNVIPNLDKNVKNHDPMGALDGGNDGLDAYRTIFSGLDSILKPEGFAIFEIGFDQAETVPRLSKDYGLTPNGLYHDLAGNPRAVDIFIDEKAARKWG